MYMILCSTVARRVRDTKPNEYPSATDLMAIQSEDRFAYYLLILYHAKVCTLNTVRKFVSFSNCLEVDSN